MNRLDLIAEEHAMAARYEREAKRRSKQPRLAARLREWADASRKRAAEMKHGPLFGGKE